jgi:hypothetical protein
MQMWNFSMLCKSNYLRLVHGSGVILSCVVDGVWVFTANQRTQQPPRRAQQSSRSMCEHLISGARRKVAKSGA